jgi:hypothetical protein
LKDFETRSLPNSLVATHRGFAFYVAFPKSSIRPVGLPIHVARVPAAPFARRYRRDFTLITRSPQRPCASYLAALPSTRAIETRSLPTLARRYPRDFTFYVADPTRSIPRSHVFYVADPISSIETRLLPTLARSYPRHFTFYVARPTRSIRAGRFLCPFRGHASAADTAATTPLRGTHPS